MRKQTAVFAAVCLSLISLFLAVGLGSVFISPKDITNIIGNYLFHLPLGNVTEINATIFWEIRLPRTLTAFLVGGCLAASGTIMQSILRNPLASSYTLGVSSGASLGAAIVILFGSSMMGIAFFVTPVVAFVTGLCTVFLVMGLAEYFDKSLENQTIILVGMVVSLFANAILTLLTALLSNHLQQLIFWQMGSFSAKTWQHVAVIAPILVIGTFVFIRFSTELDLLTFGEEQALSSGVEVKRIKLLLIIFAALLTGISVSFCGTIGFVDLIAPHIARRMFGASHKIVIPMSILIGGSLMMIADLISRTVLAPRQLPVGAITALIGAPFFAFIYFKKQRRMV